MRIAVEGCSHGCLDKIYASVLAVDKRDGKRTDLVVLCGDVQTLRNRSDLHCLAVPDKYKAMGDFHRYYADAPTAGSSKPFDIGQATNGSSGTDSKRVAPYLTIMIGGNHEASNYLWELYYGGWVAPNIYYLGAAGCVEIDGLVIAGISGIYKSHDFRLGRHERMPYDAGSVRSIYHTRCFDTFRLHMLARLNRRARRYAAPQLLVSHDWPNTIEQHGDTRWLLNKKPFFREEVQSRSLGSPPLYDLLLDLKPAYWFSAHLHVRFAALVKHASLSSASEYNQTAAIPAQSSADNAEEIEIDIDDEDAETAAEGAEVQVPPEQSNGDDIGARLFEATNAETRFLALSKCLEGQDFLQILDLPSHNNGEKDAADGPGIQSAQGSPLQPTLRFHKPWLAVLRATHRFLSLQKQQTPLPSLDDEAFHEELEEELRWIESKTSQEPMHCAQQSPSDGDASPLAIQRVQSFVRTAPDANSPQGAAPGPPLWYTNPQTVALCDFIGIENKINPPPPQALLPSQPVANAPSGGDGPQPAPTSTLQTSEAEVEETRRIEEAAQVVMDRKTAEEAPPLVLEDDEEDYSRWKEGTG